MVLDAVTSLSGDEGLDKPIDKRTHQPRPGLCPKFPGPQRALARGFKQKKTRKLLTSIDPSKLRHIIASRCGCQADCFEPFRNVQSLWNQWVNLRKLFRSMTKLEQDNYVGNLVAAPRIHAKCC